MNKTNLTKNDVQTFEDACKIKGIDPLTTIPDFSLFPEKHREAIIALAKLIIIAEVLNTIENDGEIWEPNWDNWSEIKYYPWFEMGSSSGGFSCDDCVFWYAYSNVGSRLCFKTSELAKYAGKQFKELYKAYFVL